MAGGVCTIERSRQNTTKTASPAATTIVASHLCLSAEQLKGRRVTAAESSQILLACLRAGRRAPRAGRARRPTPPVYLNTLLKRPRASALLFHNRWGGRDLGPGRRGRFGRLRTLADAEFHRKGPHTGPAVSLAPLDEEGLAGAVGPQSPVRVWRGLPLQLQRLVRGLFDAPRFSSIGRFVKLVAVCVTSLAAVDNQAAAALPGEDELLD